MASRGSVTAALLLVWVSTALAAEVDEHTLFYCSYDHGGVADFSVGSPQPEGVVGLTEGRQGSALSSPLGLLPFEQSLAPVSTGIQYSSTGNLNLQQGTIELWVRVYGAVVGVGEGTPTLRYLVSSGRYTTENHGFALVFSRFDDPAAGAYTLVWTRGNGAAKEKNWAVSTLPQWQPGEWHHVAVTYSPTEDALFVDGKLVGRTATTEAMDIIGSNFALGANIYHGHVADCAIDQVRISDHVRYAADFTP